MLLYDTELITYKLASGSGSWPTAFGGVPSPAEARFKILCSAAYNLNICYLAFFYISLASYK